jgi:hypothetical protein
MCRGGLHGTNPGFTHPEQDATSLLAYVQSAEPRRKLLNCIVDDTAFVAGIKKSTRDGFRKWVAMNAIRLFIPLHSKSSITRSQGIPLRLSS